MKYTLLLMVVISACSSPQPTKFPGTYTCAFEHEYGKTDDTIIVRKLNEGKNVFQVEMHTGFVRNNKSKKLPKELTSRNWVADFDDKKFTFVEKNGTIILWNRAEQALLLGKRKYQKIK